MSFKEYFEGTVAADIAQVTDVKKIQKRTPEHENCMNDNGENCMEELQGLDESPVGQVGRTSIKDAEEYLGTNPELLKRFKKIIKELGGITVTRKLLMQLSSKGL